MLAALYLKFYAATRTSTLSQVLCCHTNNQHILERGLYKLDCKLIVLTEMLTMHHAWAWRRAYITPVTHQLIPTGAFLPVVDTPYDLNNSTRLSHNVQQVRLDCCSAVTGWWELTMQVQ